MSRNYLSKNDELRKGDYLMSNNGEYKAIFQKDGNFVIYGWSPVWSSDTAGTDAMRICMQRDSNLVMYTVREEPRWSTNTGLGKCSMSRLRLTDEGKLVVHRESTEVWSSDMNKGVKL